MSNQILLKRSNITGATPAPESLSPGELAINTASGNLYAKTDDGTVVCLNPTVNPYYSYYSGPDSDLNEGNWVNGLRSDNPGNEYFSGIFFSTPTVTDTSVPYAIGQGYKGPYGYSLNSATTKSAQMSSQATNPNNGDVFRGSLSIRPAFSYSYRHSDVNNNQLSNTEITASEGTVSISTAQGLFPATVSATLQLTPSGGATLTNSGNISWSSNSLITQGYADTRYAPIGGNGTTGVSSFNTRTGNITLLQTDVQPLTDPLYLQVFKDTQTTQSILTQFGQSSFVQSSNPSYGFSRGLLTSNTSGTVTRSVFDGNVYYSSGIAYPTFKRIAVNSNQTGGTNATGRLQVSTYGDVTADSQTVASGYTRTAALSVNSQQGFSLAQDINPAFVGSSLYCGKLTSNGTNSGTESGTVFCGDLVQGVALGGGYVGSPYTTYLRSTNTWPVANSNASFPYTPNYQTYLTLGANAELIFLNYNTQSLRVPEYTANSILTQGYADTRYAAIGQSGGVSSFNGRTGNITLVAGDVQPLTDPLYVPITSSASVQAKAQSLTLIGNIGAYLQTTTTRLTVLNGTITADGVTSWYPSSLITQDYADTRYAPLGGGGVSSFNDRTGNVTLLDSDVTPFTDPLYVPLSSQSQITIQSGSDFQINIGTGQSFIVSTPQSPGFRFDDQNGLTRVGFEPALSDSSYITRIDGDRRYITQPSEPYNGSFETADGQTLTVENGIIVNVGKAKA